MKRRFFILPIIFLLQFYFFNCQVDQTKKEDSSSKDDSSSSDPFAGIIKRDMILITTGTYTQTDDGTTNPGHGFTHTITGFQMAKYEVTYELWYTVRTWALENGYNFQNLGIEGNDGTAGEAPTSARYEPVTTINWRDAIVWCNAYSQMAGLTSCYTISNAVVKDSRDTNVTACNNAVCNWSANGYRLPSEGEWQFAAGNMGVTQWNYGSGGTGSYTGINAADFPLFDPIAWYGSSTTIPDGNTTATRDVGGKNANALGIYDLSGNVSEFCWDWHDVYPQNYPGGRIDYRGMASGANRVARGGNWDSIAEYLQVGYRSYFSPGYGGSVVGFRVARIN